MDPGKSCARHSPDAIPVLGLFHGCCPRYSADRLRGRAAPPASSILRLTGKSICDGDFTRSEATGLFVRPAMFFSQLVTRRRCQIDAYRREASSISTADTASAGAIDNRAMDGRAIRTSIDMEQCPTVAALPSLACVEPVGIGCVGLPCPIEGGRGHAERIEKRRCVAARSFLSRHLACGFRSSQQYAPSCDRACNISGSRCRSARCGRRR